MLVLSKKIFLLNKCLFEYDAVIFLLFYHNCWWFSINSIITVITIDLNDNILFLLFAFSHLRFSITAIVLIIYIWILTNSKLYIMLLLMAIIIVTTINNNFNEEQNNAILSSRDSYFTSWWPSPAFFHHCRHLSVSWDFQTAISIFYLKSPFFFYFFMLFVFYFSPSNGEVDNPSFVTAPNSDVLASTTSTLLILKR